jgi:hypothetical protein
MYGNGYPWTLQSYTRAGNARPFYAVRAGHPPNGLTAFSGVAVFYALGYPTMYGPGIFFSPLINWSLEDKRRTARGGHGLPIASLGLAVPNPFITPCGQGRVGARQVAIGHLLPPWTPHTLFCLGNKKESAGL